MSNTALTVLHTSDYQCGAPFQPEAADAMHRLAESVAPDVVVASGDLTQRAKVREFRQARSVLDRFGDVPLILTPGNHDVPLYRFWERLVDPYRNWRKFAGEALDTVTRVPGATFVALNSSAPRRAIVNGRIDGPQVDFARRAFEGTPQEDLRVLVIHHHFIPVADGEGGRPLPRAAALARQFEAMEVDVVLGGHVHQLHMHSSEELGGAPAEEAVPFLATGTTTSRRGRGVEEGWNSLCVLRFAGSVVDVTPYRRRADGAAFEPSESLQWRLGRGAEHVG
jgi:3',5'-cyclic AMP phosphodiesterase CpdA